MFKQKDIFFVKKDIKKFVGAKIKFESGKGRQTTQLQDGIISDAYDSVFVIQIYENAVPTRKVSFNYTDILTRNVQITVCD